jgi:hypothetical protein
LSANACSNSQMMCDAVFPTLVAAAVIVYLAWLSKILRW